MKIKWLIEDGYVGGARPQYVNVPDEELEACENRTEQRVIIDDYVNGEFRDKITPYWDEAQLNLCPKPGGEST